MAIPLYLSMTAAEFAACRELPVQTAWMACHFSPYGTGLTNLPRQLPPDSLLILNDRTPICGHDPVLVCQTLLECIQQLHCRGLLLDFQRPNCRETAALVKKAASLPCPVCISDIYAKDLDCPVFLPPVPLTLSPEAHLSPWKGREIWLEAATEHTVFTVTANGCTEASGPAEGDFPFREDRLHCRYRTELQGDRAVFYLSRSRADLNTLLEEAASLGVTMAVGLWQELQ